MEGFLLLGDCRRTYKELSGKVDIYFCVFYRSENCCVMSSDTASVFLILLRCRLASKNKVEVRRKQWTDEDMVSAMKAVADKNMTINAVLPKFSVPRG